MSEYYLLKNLTSAGEYETKLSGIINNLDQCNYSDEVLFSSQLQIINSLIALEENIRRLRNEQKESKKNATEIAKNIIKENGRLQEADKAKVRLFQSHADEIGLEIKLHQFMHWMFRYAGDGIAWRAFGYNRRMIRALGGKQPIPFISGRDTTDKETMIFNALRKCDENWLPIMHDLTNCLRTFDFSIFKNGKLIDIFELKIKKGKKREIHKRVSERITLQVERSSRILEFLETRDLGLLQEDLASGKSIDIDSFEKHNFAALSEAINTARENGIGYIEPEPGLLYVSWDNEKRLENKAIEETSIHHPHVFDSMITFRSMGPIYNMNHQYLPVTAMELPCEDITDIIFSRIAVICIINFKCLEKFCREKGVPLYIQQDEGHKFLVKSESFEGEVREGLWDRVMLEALSMESFAGLIKGIMDNPDYHQC